MSMWVSQDVVVLDDKDKKNLAEGKSVIIFGSGLELYNHPVDTPEDFAEVFFEQMGVFHEGDEQKFIDLP